MKAAVVYEVGKSPVFADFEAPVARAGEELVTVKAAALTRSDGVGVTQDGRRVYFILPGAPFGAMAEITRVRAAYWIPVPDGIDDVTAAALANPGMFAWAALVCRARIKQGDTVLINGATGIAGRLAVQLTKHLGAGKVIATARDVVDYLWGKSAQTIIVAIAKAVGDVRASPIGRPDGLGRRPRKGKAGLYAVGADSSARGACLALARCRGIADESAPTK